MADISSFNTGSSTVNFKDSQARTDISNVYTKSQSDDRYVLLTNVTTTPSSAEITQTISNIWGS